MQYAYEWLYTERNYLGRRELLQRTEQEAGEEIVHMTDNILVNLKMVCAVLWLFPQK